MRFCKAVLAVPILFSVAVVASWSPDSEGHCTTSDSCPADSKCVDKYCVSCKFDPKKCMRSVEKCKECHEDEGCYFRDVKDTTTGNVVSTVVCAKSDPCSDPKFCDGQRCTSIECGDQPPFGQCGPYYHTSPCWRKGCPPGQTCFTRASLCKTEHSSVIMKDEGVCFPEAECYYCNAMRERCEVRKNAIGYEGFCANFKNIQNANYVAMN